MSNKYFATLVTVLLLAVCLVPERVNAEEFSDLVSIQGDPIVVRINSILTGLRAVSAGVIDEYDYKKAMRLGRRIVYMNVSVTNSSLNGPISIFTDRFRIVDTKGNVYKGSYATDYINEDIDVGRTGRGGVSFSLYLDSVPDKLECESGAIWLDSGKKMIQEISDLSKLSIFKQ